MKKIILATTCAAALLNGLPKQAEASSRNMYVAGMAVAYCMHKEGGWTQAKSGEFFTSQMRKHGVSDSLISYYHSKDSTTGEIVKVIADEGGCVSMVNSIRSGERPRSSPSPASVLSDTPFHF